jgi:hypothetical protein
MTPKNYTILNYIFAGIILAIFFYSALFSPNNPNYPIKCIHQELLGGPCPTCGLSRGFSAILHFHFSQAKQIQPNTFSVFSFFFIQLLFRVFLIFLLQWKPATLRGIANIDIIVSALMFFYFFRHLIVQTLYIFYKMMLTGIVR